jgi:hypothetical protein
LRLCAGRRGFRLLARAEAVERRRGKRQFGHRGRRQQRRPPLDKAGIDAARGKFGV